MMATIIVTVISTIIFSTIWKNFLKSHTYLLLIDKVPWTIFLNFSEYRRRKRDEFDQRLRSEAIKYMDNFIKEKGGDAFIKKCEEDNEALGINSLVKIDNYTRHYRWLYNSDDSFWNLIKNSHKNKSNKK
jgi:hypothetical protein